MELPVLLPIQNITRSVYFDYTQEQVEWAAEEGADFILAETYTLLSEALLALDVIKKYGKGKSTGVKENPLEMSLEY